MAALIWVYLITPLQGIVVKPDSSWSGSTLASAPATRHQAASIIWINGRLTRNAYKHRGWAVIKTKLGEQT
jgi:hypothetical protein